MRIDPRIAALAFAASLPTALMGQVVSSANDEAMKRLATERGCMLCHAEAGKPVIGTPPYAPAFRDIAARYRTRADAEEVLTRLVISGTSPDRRHWPRGAAFESMLPNQQEATPEEARALVRWILSLGP
jgi:cytochrome c